MVRKNKHPIHSLWSLTSIDEVNILWFLTTIILGKHLKSELDYKKVLDNSK